jgi:hypothetical protein
MDYFLRIVTHPPKRGNNSHKFISLALVNMILCATVIYCRILSGIDAGLFTTIPKGDARRF